jgi:hypothetical protein
MMPVADPDALRFARDFALEAEEILGITGIVDKLNALSEDSAAAQEAQDRFFETGIDLGDIATIAQAIITLFTWIVQIRKEKVLKGASRNDIIYDLSIRVLDSDSLTPGVKERLVSKALDVNRRPKVDRDRRPKVDHTAG